jgi:hypothetical protein
MVDYNETLEVVKPRDVALHMITAYSHGIKDHTANTVEAISDLCARVKRPEYELDSFLMDVAQMISRLFGIANTAIAVWDQTHQVYRYRVVNGLETKAADAYKNITYTKEHVIDERTYPSHKISRHTQLYLCEEHPYAEGEEKSYQRPALLGMKRRSLSDSLEGDYMCFDFTGAGDELMGWIETSGTRQRRLPETSEIRWIELIARIVGTVIQLKY